MNEGDVVILRVRAGRRPAVSRPWQVCTVEKLASWGAYVRLPTGEVVYRARGDLAPQRKIPLTGGGAEPGTRRGYVHDRGADD